MALGCGAAHTHRQQHAWLPQAGEGVHALFLLCPPLWGVRAEGEDPEELLPQDCGFTTGSSLGGWGAAGHGGRGKMRSKVSEMRNGEGERDEAG